MLDRPSKVRVELASLLALVAFAMPQAAPAEPFQLGVETKQTIDNGPPPVENYPAPTMMQPAYQPMPPVRKPMHASAQDGGSAPPRQPMKMAITKTVLPPAFMGRWLVMGQRASVEAINPEFQQNAESKFQVGTRNIWSIEGSPQQGYMMSNDQGVHTTLTIVKVANDTATIFYQHPVFPNSPVMAQEKIIMQLQNGGANFQGLEAIDIVKQGQKRATVKYQLSGSRQ